ncbi:hypothetical protein, conserved [Eimeria praecox]|uniref:Uncharacterized protein n=1 Tax=Eimeria praecox TaxID=51316 RepID=U6H9P7_9EIME|nr:hypothetical protein, conserved [Eimeria praecox]
MTVKKEDDDFWSYVANVVGQREKMNRKDKEGKTKKGMQIPFSWEYGTPQVAGGEAQAIEAEKIEKKEDTNNQIEESKVENEQEKEIQVEGNEDTSTEVLLAQPQQQTSPFYINTTAAAEEEKEIEKEKEHEAEIATEQEENKHENKQEEINKEAKEEEKENEVSEVVNPNPAGDERDEEINRIIIEEKRKYREKYSNYYSELSKNLRTNPRPLYRNIVWRRDQEEASAAPTAAAARAAAAPTAAAARAAAPTVKPPGYLGKKPFVSRYTQGADGFYYRTDKPLPPPRTVSAATLPSLSPELQQQLQQQQQQLEQQLKQQALQQKMKEECRRYHMMGLQERQQLLLQQQFLQTQSYSTSAAVGGKLRETPKVEWSQDGTEAPAPPTRCDVAMAFFLANRKELHLV